jgi:hypothetical protein
MNIGNEVIWSLIARTSEEKPSILYEKGEI